KRNKTCCTLAGPHSSTSSPRGSGPSLFLVGFPGFRVGTIVFVGYPSIEGIPSEPRTPRQMFFVTALCDRPTRPHPEEISSPRGRRHVPTRMPTRPHPEEISSPRGTKTTVTYVISKT